MMRPVRLFSWLGSVPWHRWLDERNGIWPIWKKLPKASLPAKSRKWTVYLTYCNACTVDLIRWLLPLKLFTEFYFLVLHSIHSTYVCQYGLSHGCVRGSWSTVSCASCTVNRRLGDHKDETWSRPVHWYTSCTVSRHRLQLSSAAELLTSVPQPAAPAS